MTNIKSVVSSIIFLVLLCIFSCVCLPLSDAFHKDVPITLIYRDIFIDRDDRKFAVKSFFN